MWKIKCRDPVRCIPSRNSLQNNVKVWKENLSYPENQYDILNSDE